jgi:hypothetical protein
MRLLISALAAASFLGFALASYAADEPYPAKPAEEGPKVTAPNKPKPAGRAADKDQTVTAPNKPKPAGRAANKDQTVTAPNKPKPAGRAANKDQTVSAPNKPKPAGRAAEGTTGSDANKPGGVVNEEKK